MIFDFDPRSRLVSACAVAFELVDANIVAKTEHGSPALHNARERSVVPELERGVFAGLHAWFIAFALASPARASSHGLRDRAAHRSNEARVGIAIPKFDMEMQVIADIRHRQHAHAIHV